MKKPPDMATWHITSGFGSNTRQPFIEVRVTERRNGKDVEVLATQINPEAARGLAMNLLMAAEAAGSDAVIVQFAAALDLDQADTGRLLRLFRDLRAQRAGDAASTA